MKSAPILCAALFMFGLAAGGVVRTQEGGEETGADSSFSPIDIEELFSKEDLLSTLVQGNLVDKIYGQLLNSTTNGFRCRHTWCAATFNIKVFKKNFRFFILVQYLKNNIGVKLTVKINGRPVFTKEISARNPPPICIKLPVARFVKVCLKLNNLHVSRHQISGCAMAYAKVGFHFKVNLGCFRINIAGEDGITRETDLEGTESAGGAVVLEDGDDDTSEISSENWGNSVDSMFELTEEDLQIPEDDTEADKDSAIIKHFIDADEEPEISTKNVEADDLFYQCKWINKVYACCIMLTSKYKSCVVLSPLNSGFILGVMLNKHFLYLKKMVGTQYHVTLSYKFMKIEVFLKNIVSNSHTMKGCLRFKIMIGHISKHVVSCFHKNFERDNLIDGQMSQNNLYIPPTEKNVLHFYKN